MTKALWEALSKAKAKWERGLLRKCDVITDILSELQTDKELEEVRSEIAKW